MLKFIRFVLFSFGCVCVVISMALFWQQYRPNKYRFHDFSRSENSSRFTLSHLSYKDIELPIEDGRIQNGRWPLSNDSLVYLKDSGVVGQTGNAVIYGHNWDNLLGFLKNIKPGEKIRLTSSNNEHYSYIVETVQEVSADQTHILSPTDDKRLTLYTCSGLFDRKRLVVVAKMGN